MFPEGHFMSLASSFCTIKSQNVTGFPHLVGYHLEPASLMTFQCKYKSKPSVILFIETDPYTMLYCTYYSNLCFDHNDRRENTKIFNQIWILFTLFYGTDPESKELTLNTLRPRQNGRYFPDDILKCIFLNENVWILIMILLKFVLKSPISNILALVQIMAWCRPGNKPLSEPVMVSLLVHICITRPQWVNVLRDWVISV